jgi:hypothetical protein
MNKLEEIARVAFKSDIRIMIIITTPEHIESKMVL